MNIYLNDIPLYPFLDYFNRSMEKGKLKNNPAVEMTGVINPKNPEIDNNSEYVYLCQEDKTDENNKNAEVSNKYYLMNLNNGHLTAKTESQMAAYLVQAVKEKASRKKISFIVLDDDEFVTSFQAYEYSGNLENQSYVYYVIIPNVLEAQKVNSQGLPLYVDYLGIETTMPSYNNSFYKHQQTLRDRFYKLSNTSAWLQDEHFANNIGLLQKTGIDSKTKFDRCQLAYWVSYKETKTYSKINKPSNVVLDGSYLSNHIYEALINNNTFTETLIRKVPVTLKYLHEYPIVESPVDTRNITSISSITNKVKAGNYIIKPFTYETNIGGTEMQIKKTGVINKVSMVINKRRVEERTVASSPIYEVKKEWRGSGAPNSASGYWYSYRTGNIIGYTDPYTYYETIEESPKSYSYTNLEIHDIDLPDPYISFDFDLETKIHLCVGTDFKIIIKSNSGEITISGTIKESKGLTETKIDLGDLKGVISSIPDKETTYRMTISLPVINKNYLSPESYLLCYVHANSSLSSFTESDTKSLDNSINTTDYTDYYFCPGDATKVIEVAHTFTELPSGTISTPSSLPLTFNKLVNKFIAKELYNEDIYYKLRGPHVDGGIFKAKREESFKNLFQNIISEDNENVNLNEVFVQSSSLVDFYNYAKGIDTFIKQDSINKNYTPFTNNRALIDYNKENSQIILYKDFYSPRNDSDIVLTSEKEYSRELLQRLAEYQKYPMNYLYDKERRNELTDKVIISNIENRPNDELNYKLSFENNNDKYYNPYDRVVKLATNALTEYYLSGNAKAFSDIVDGLYKVAVNNLQDTPIETNHYTEEKKVYNTFDPDIDNLLKDLMTKTMTSVTIEEGTENEEVVLLEDNKWHIL